MFFYLIIQIFSRGSHDEFEMLNVYNGIGLIESSHEDDPTPTSKFAFVSYYSGEDELNHYILNQLVMGYNLMSFSPQYDRVLILPTNLEIPKEFQEKIKIVWTHIIRRSYIKWPCENKEEDVSDRHHWFKIQAFSLIQYSKILFLGPYSYITKDLSPIFQYFSPSSPPDFQSWGFSHLGFVRNFDFLLIIPSFGLFHNVTHLGCDWISDPIEHSTQIGKQYRNSISVGVYDNGLLEEYFQGHIQTLPFFWQFEVISPQYRTKNAPNITTDLRIYTYRFSVDSRPWYTEGIIKDDIIFQAYTSNVQKINNFFEDSLNLSIFNLIEIQNEKAHFISNKLNNPLPLDHYTVYEFYDDFAENGETRELLRCISLILGSISIVIFAILDAPISSKDKKNTELFE